MKAFNKIRSIKKQAGATMVEYAIMVVLISVVAILAIQGIGSEVNEGFETVNSALSSANG